MNLYNEYCYPDLITIAEVIKSSPFIFSGEVINDVVVSGSSSQNLKIKFQSSTANIIITPPTCTDLGFNKTYLGISFEDSQELAWLVSFVLITAFAVKTLKRTL